MAIYFSEKFKSLRKNCDLTQEQIADMFHISPQAVSRWETGVTYPDIELLPALADFFNVTVDDLLGIDISKKEARIEEIIDQMCDALDRHSADDEIEVLRNGLQEFPSNLYLTYRLAGALFNKTWELKNSENKDELKKYADESIQIHKRLINESNHYTTLPVLEEKYGCTYSDVRYGSMQALAYQYTVVGEYEEAVVWANKLPRIDCTQEVILPRILKGEEKLKRLKANVSLFSRELKQEVEMLSWIKHDNPDSSEEQFNFTKEYEEIKSVLSVLEKYVVKEV